MYVAFMPTASQSKSPYSYNSTYQSASQNPRYNKYQTNIPIEHPITAKRIGKKLVPEQNSSTITLTKSYKISKTEQQIFKFTNKHNNIDMDEVVSPIYNITNKAPVSDHNGFVVGSKNSMMQFSHTNREQIKGKVQTASAFGEDKPLANVKKSKTLTHPALSADKNLPSLPFNATVAVAANSDNTGMPRYVGRARDAIMHLWHQRSQAPVFISTNFSKTRSRLKAEALEMATIQLKMPKKDIWKCLVAELLGTCLLIIMGCGSILSLPEQKQLDLTGIGLCWGLAVATLAQTLGHVSGCHINPAVTLTMLVTGKLQLVKAGLYIVVQCIGATMGAAVLKALTPDGIQGDWGITKLGSGVTPIQGFGIEFVATFFLLIIIFGATDENRNDVKGSAPLAIGLCVTTLVLFCGPFTGASMNPARSLGPSILAGHWESHWVYWIGPIAGAIAAGTFYQQVFRALSPIEIATIQAEEDIKKRDSETKESAIPNV